MGQIAGLIALFEKIAALIPGPLAEPIAVLVHRVFGRLLGRTNPAQHVARLVTKAHDAAVRVAALASADDATATGIADGWVSAWEAAADELEGALVLYTPLQLAVERAEADGDQGAIAAARLARRPASAARDAAVTKALARLLGGA